MRPNKIPRMFEGWRAWFASRKMLLRNRENRWITGGNRWAKGDHWCVPNCFSNWFLFFANFEVQLWKIRNSNQKKIRQFSAIQPKLSDRISKCDSPGRLHESKLKSIDLCPESGQAKVSSHVRAILFTVRLSGFRDRSLARTSRFGRKHRKLLWRAIIDLEFW